MMRNTHTGAFLASALIVVLCGLPATRAEESNLSASAASAAPDSAEIYGWARDIAGFGVRMPGTEASERAAAYIHDRFKEFGLERVGYETANTLRWSAFNQGLRVNGRKIPSSPILHTFHNGKPGKFSTGSEGIEAELVYVGDGSASSYWFKDVRGKIVVANVHFGKSPFWLYRPFLLGVQDSANTFGWGYELVNPYSGGAFPGSYYRAMERGAVGFIGVLVDYFDSHAYHNEAYKSYDHGFAMSMPGLWLSPVAGETLIESIEAAAEEDQVLRANLVLEGELRVEAGRAVMGYLPGQTDEIILVESHHDSSTPGATEDASGAAEVLALARYFSRVPLSERRRTLMFATMDTHFTDYALHRKFARRHLIENNELGENVVAVITVEHIANEWLAGPDRKPVPSGLLAPRAIMVSTEVEGFEEITLAAMKHHELERSVAVSTGLLQFIGGTSGIPADSSDFLRAGVPVIALVGAPLYLYDSIDTMDKVPQEELGRVARAFIEIVHGVDDLPSENFRRLPDNRDPEESAAPTMRE